MVQGEGERCRRRENGVGGGRGKRRPYSGVTASTRTFPLWCPTR